MTDIRSISDIQLLIRAGCRDWKQFGEVNAVYHHDMVLFNYSQMAQFMGRWNWFEQNSRGLVFHATTGEVIARPFRKFFNYGERMPMQDARIVEVTEKMDGSLGILYREDRSYKIATRGSFTSEQAVWATKEVQTHHLEWGTGVPNNLTLLFEIIYPENRVVVDYGSFAGLVLIGARDRFYGQELYAGELDVLAAKWGFLRPKTYDFTDVRDILAAAEALSANEEGWVLRYSDNERYKIKGAAYRLAHKMMTGVNFNRVLEAVSTGQYEAMIEGVPDEFLGLIKTYKAEIDTVMAGLRTQVAEALAAAPNGSQKDFALWVQRNYPKAFHGYLFAAKAGKDVDDLAYRHAFENRVETQPVRELDT